VDWYPEKPTLVQVTFGIVFFIVLAALPLYWSLSEPDVGNRVFLWILAGMLLLLATWRMGIAIRLTRDRRRR
jgi:cell division protein FtsW (lipid II flippase)